MGFRSRKVDKPDKDGKMLGGESVATNAFSGERNDNISFPIGSEETRKMGVQNGTNAVILQLFFALASPEGMDEAAWVVAMKSIASELVEDSDPKQADQHAKESFQQGRPGGDGSESKKILALGAEEEEAARKKESVRSSNEFLHAVLNLVSALSLSAAQVQKGLRRVTDRMVWERRLTAPLLVTQVEFEFFDNFIAQPALKFQLT